MFLISRLNNSVRRLLNLSLMLGIYLLMGCAAGTDYVPPEISLPSHWHTTVLQKNMVSGERRLAQWRDIINDPMLDRLMQQVVENNLDVQQALSSVREARYQRIQTRSSLFPSLDASTSIRNSGSNGGNNALDSSSKLYTAGLDAGWELDLFGGNRRAFEASQADLDAQIEDYNNVMVSLLAETALNYIELRTAQKNRMVTLDNVRAQQETWELLTALSAAGGGDELAVAQARYNLENSRATIPDLNAQIEAAMNRLAVLVGQPAGSLHEELSPVTDLPEVGIELAVGIPADILRQRPDIRRAERNLAAQTARTGEAVSERWPKLNLSGSIGLEALSASDFFSAPTRLWSLGPTLTMPIFNADAVAANIKISEERQQQALLEYKATLLAAVEEVENALVDYAADQRKSTHLHAAVTAARLAGQLAEQQYTTGLTDFNDVLEAQRSLLSFEAQLVELQGALLSDVIRLYKALGGGWQHLPLEKGILIDGTKNE